MCAVPCGFRWLITAPHRSEHPAIQTAKTVTLSEVEDKPFRYSSGVAALQELMPKGSEQDARSLLWTAAYDAEASSEAVSGTGDTTAGVRASPRAAWAGYHDNLGLPKCQDTDRGGACRDNQVNIHAYCSFNDCCSRCVPRALGMCS